MSSLSPNSWELSLTASGNVTSDCSQKSAPHGVSEEKTYPGAIVTINGHRTTADAEGRITCTMPLLEQDTEYTLSSSLTFADNILYMPTTGSTIIEVK